MVFRKDPRAGYCTIDFNIEWFYQYLDERGEELIITKTSATGYEYNEDDLNRRESCLEKYIERAVEYYIGYSVFGNKSKRIIMYKEVDLSGYDSVYDIMYDTMIDFLDENPDYYTLRAVDSVEKEK
jgi:hypothetical protein